MNPASLANLQPPFPPGQSANPGGKPTGARNKLNARFLNSLIESFEQGGRKAIDKCRDEDPSAFVRALVALQPKEIEVRTDPLSELSDEQLESVVLAVRTVMAAQGPGAGAGPAQDVQSAQGVPALPEAS